MSPPRLFPRLRLAGWVKLHRKILDSALFDSMSPSDFKVFIACLCLANNTARPWFNGQLEEEIPRGSFVTSQRKLAKLTHLSWKSVRGSLDRLQRTGSIWAKPRAHHSTLITVVNFEHYQDDALDAGTEKGTERAQSGH